MAINVIRPGYVHIFPDVLGWRDVLSRARTLLEEHGWIKGESGGPDRGWSLHGAIGEASAKLTGDTGGKSGTVARPLRDEAVLKISEVMPKDYKGAADADIRWNDKQRSKTAVLSMIDKALTA